MLTESKKYELGVVHASVLRDALENQIESIEDKLIEYRSVFVEEEKERLRHCLALRHEVLDLILRILNASEGTLVFSASNHKV